MSFYFFGKLSKNDNFLGFFFQNWTWFWKNQQFKFLSANKKRPKNYFSWLNLKAVKSTIYMKNTKYSEVVLYPPPLHKRILISSILHIICHSIRRISETSEKLICNYSMLCIFRYLSVVKYSKTILQQNVRTQMCRAVAKQMYRMKRGKSNQWTNSLRAVRTHSIRYSYNIRVIELIFSPL